VFSVKNVPVLHITPPLDALAALTPLDRFRSFGEGLIQTLRHVPQEA
jgi:hypothetical protein